MDIANRVKKLRKALDLTQHQLAELVGVAQNSIQKLEKGDTMSDNDEMSKFIKQIEQRK